ncbi:hypothetical protein GOP47_0001805 [Adiantum capillus-veneris]|uniref:Uncharacterized protein n=1 Tax=Adiantum capillus-veneris TaxID=13818 RepID=A0A9D4VAS5_ADICA|nr:hypothetical protein GOP47_0001805 [Adiantum capillus-veneris]
MVAMAAASATPSSTSAMAVKCASPSPASTATTAPAKLGYSRRLLLPGLVCAPLLLQQQAAMAKDIPLFGIRKRVEQAEKEVVKEVKELVKEGEQLVKEGEKEISSVVAPAAAAVASKPSFDSPPPAYQAAGVVGAELVAVLIASSVVTGLVVYGSVADLMEEGLLGHQ